MLTNTAPSPREVLGSKPTACSGRRLRSAPVPHLYPHFQQAWPETWPGSGSPRAPDRRSKPYVALVKGQGAQQTLLGPHQRSAVGCKHPPGHEHLAAGRPRPSHCHQSSRGVMAPWGQAASYPGFCSTACQCVLHSRRLS